MKLKNNVKLIQTKNPQLLQRSDGISVTVDEKDLWLIKLLSNKAVTMDKVLDLIGQHNKEEYPWTNFTLAQFIVNYADYIDD